MKYFFQRRDAEDAKGRRVWIILSALLCVLCLSAFSASVPPPLASSKKPAAASGGGPPSSGLVQHLKADALSGSDGDDKTTWTATVGKNATGSAGATGKFYNSVVNGLPVIRFAGVADPTADTMATAAFDAALTQPCVVFLVVKLAGTGTTQRMFSDIVDGGGTRAIFRNDSVPIFDIYAGGGAFEDTEDIGTGWNILSVELNGASSKYKRNGGTETAFSNPGSGAFTGLRISGDYDGTIQPAAMDVAEVLMYSGTIADKSAHFTYLNGKYAIY